LRLFLEKGYEATSIRIILDEVGGEEGIFYFYCKSKNETFDVAIQHILSSHAVRVGESLTQEMPEGIDAAFELMGQAISAIRKLAMTLSIGQSSFHSVF
jgi:AcrR family transcriptional regulator